MPQYMKLGKVPPKRHTELKAEPGFRDEGIYYEEVITLAGFGRAYSIAYHLRPPTRVISVEPAGRTSLEFVERETLQHVHLKTADLPASGDPISGRVALLANDDVVLSRCRPSEEQSTLYRNVTADEVLFVHQGTCVLHSMFGTLRFKPYDYVVVPRCTTYRLEFTGDVKPDLLIVEAANNLDIPKKYFNADGQLRLGAPFSERDFHGPIAAPAVNEEKETPILIKSGQQWTRMVLASHPFDVVGWDGCVYPFTFNADDFEPITGTVHQPPPIHLTFETTGFVLCTFAPRMLDTHPNAIKVPYAHSNVQADEVLYYVRGNFGSRRGVEQSSITLHPRGVPHGPHPGTIVASRNVTRTDELAVMVDTVNPLRLTKAAIGLEDADYPFSWLE